MEDGENLVAKKNKKDAAAVTVTSVQNICVESYDGGESTAHKPRPIMTSSGFKDSHRLFLQAAISRRIMTEVAAQDLYRQVCQVTQGMTSQPLLVPRKLRL